MNRRDQAGLIMSFLVWLLIGMCFVKFRDSDVGLSGAPLSLLDYLSSLTTLAYSGVTVTLLAHHNHLPGVLAMIYATFCALALASHAKTMFTDPGAVPEAAVPILIDKQAIHAMCVHCQSYKPRFSHHCRICNRCISRMDHHCPWMNNCIGAANMSTSCRV
jgi:hypothetical protein